jgi:hypothetical protein
MQLERCTIMPNFARTNPVDRGVDERHGQYAHQVRIDGTGEICGFLEGTFEIDGDTGRFLNDVFPEPDSMVVGASRPQFPYICKPEARHRRRSAWAPRLSCQ